MLLSKVTNNCIQAIHNFFISMCVPLELNPQPFALLTQCSTTEPQEHIFRRGFLLGRTIWYSVRRMVWALTGWPPTPSTSATMLAALIHLFPKHNLWIWRWARALNFFGRPWRGLFWVEPVLLNRCMVLATVLQLSFRVLAIFLQPTPSLCRATLLFTDPQRVLWGAMLNFQWPVWESESDNTKFNTPVHHSHLRPCNTNESHDTGERKGLIGPNLDIFT